MTNDDNAPWFKYKANIIGNTEVDGTKKEVKLAVPLKYLSNFWRSNAIDWLQSWAFIKMDLKLCVNCSSNWC